MRRRAWVAWAGLALGILFGILGRVAPGGSVWNLLAGLLLLMALLLGISLLPFWRSLAPGLVDFPDLFDRPGPRDRWCASCGHPTPRAGPCRTCGNSPVSRGKSG